MTHARRTRAPDYEWADQIITAEIRSLAETVTTGDTSVAITFNRSQTVVRVRGNGHCVLDPGAAGDGMIVGCGLIVVQEEAIVAGAASLPSPIDALDASWLWHTLIPLSSGDASAQNGADINQASRFVIDSKAMRRAKNGEGLVFVMDGLRDGGTPSATVSLCARILTQLN